VLAAASVGRGRATASVVPVLGARSRPAVMRRISALTSDLPGEGR